MIWKQIISFAFVLLILRSTDANAWFFFFLPIPGSSAAGSQCVKEDAKVGDVLRSPSGNTATIKSLSGTSSRCPNAQLPVLATLEFSFSFVSHVGIDIPDGYEKKTLTDIQRFQGGVLLASNQYKSFSIYVRAQKRDVTADPSEFARSIGVGIVNAVLEGKTLNEEQLDINGMRAWRFQVTGTNKGVFGKNYTYLVTVLEGDQELVGITATVPTSDFPNEKTALIHIAETVTGIKAVAPQMAKSPVPNAIPPAQEQVIPSADSLQGQFGKSPASTTPPNVPVSATPSPNTVPPSTEIAANKLRELNKLYKEGILNQQEYEAKKQEILKGM